MFKDKLVELRKLNNDTQESLAKKLNVSRSLVAKWEQNRAYPTNEDLDNISNIYNVTYEELLSTKELKDNYGIVLKNNKKKNNIIMIISMVFSLITIVLIMINLIPNKKYIYMDENEVNTELIKYKGTMNGIEFESDFVGESEKNNFMRTENFYTYEWFQMYRYPLTDKSSIYYFHYMADFTPGFGAYFNGHLEFNKEALIKDVQLRISLSNDEIYPIYSWPNKQKESKIYKSIFYSDFAFNEEKELHGVIIKPLDDKLKLSYNCSNDLLNIMMSPSYEEQWIKFDYSCRGNYSKWGYLIKNENSKKRTLSIHQFYMFEVNENNTSEFSFKVDKKVTTEVKDKLIETNHITIYNCDITKINESV